MRLSRRVVSFLRRSYSTDIHSDRLQEGPLLNRFKYGSLVTAVCTHRYPPPSCHHIKLRRGGSFYTDFGKISHEAITRLHPGCVVRVGEGLSTCHVLFHETRREDFLDARIGYKAKTSRRFVHPHDLANLCSILGIQSGHRVLETGFDFGHLTLLLSDLVGSEGHVVATSKDPIRDDVESIIVDWLERHGSDGDATDYPLTRSNVSLHSFNASDLATAKRHISSAMVANFSIDRGNGRIEKNLKDEVLDSVSQSIVNEDDCIICDPSNSNNLLNAVIASKLPEEATRGVVEAAASLLKCGGSVGVIPLHFSHLQSLVEFIHRRRLPFFLEVLSQPESHQIHSSMKEAEMALESDGEEWTREEEESISRNEREDEAKRKLKECHMPRRRLIWAGRRYEGVWLAKFVKVSDFDFVAGAAMEVSEADRKMENDTRYEELVSDIKDRFPWSREMEAEVDDLRTKLWAELLNDHAGR